MRGLRAIAACALALAAGGCALAGGGAAGDGGDAAAERGSPLAPSADSAGTAATDSAPAAGLPLDSLRARAASSDSAYRALLDSARTLARGGGEPAAAPEPDTAADEPAASGPMADGYPGGPVTVTDVDSLRALGPVYTPYRRGPRLATREERLDGLLKATLVPVIRRYELPPDEWARYWVLVDADGRVRATTLQLPSGHSSFDAAARAVAENLAYEPALRDERPVPVWVLVRVSLLMR